MARPRKAAPELYWLDSAGCYCVTLNGRRRKLGADRAEAERRRDQLVAEWLLRGRSPGPDPRKALTVAEVATAYYRHACERADRGDLSPSRREKIAYAVEALHATYPDLPAAEFGPLKLQAVRQHICTRPNRRREGVTLSRRYANQLVGVIQTCWNWAESQELVPPASTAALRTVKALRKRQGGRETPPRLPVPAEVVAATLPHCDPVLAAMIRVQRLGGMRPQDVCRLRPCDVSRSPDQVLRPLPDLPVSAYRDPESGVMLWVYCPHEHKGTWRDRPRIVVLGPRAQAELAPWLDRPADAHCFSPAESVAAQLAAKRAARKTKVQPSQVRRAAAARKKKRQRPPRTEYSTESYGGAIAAAVKRANRQQADAVVPHWTPHQLRHDAATEASWRADEHTAAAVLGDTPDLMRTYARQAMRKAGAYAAQHG